MTEKKIVIVILHYCAIETTIDAVESIKGNVEYNNYDIVVVDNASPDNSGIRLKDRYHTERNIYVILHDKNEGFAKGNNIGYTFAREKLSPDFIIIINNDVLIEQKDFIQKVTEIYKAEKFYVMGPDIVTPDGRHQNPHRIQNYELKDVNRIIRNRTIILWYLKLKKMFHLEKQVQFIENWDDKRGIHEKEGIIRDEVQRNVVLQGSCMIFSPDFIQKEKEAFYPGTFMWMEEEILAFLCGKKEYLLLYDPHVRVLHKGGVSTTETGNNGSRYYNYSKLLLNSARVLKSIMDNKF